MSTRTHVRPTSRRARPSRSHTSSQRPRPYTPPPAPAAAPATVEKRIDWFIVALYALMVAGIAGFSVLAYILFIPVA